MAATPSKPNLSIDGGDVTGGPALTTASVAGSKDTPVEVSPVAADSTTASPTPTSPTAVPTYQSVESSDVYQLAKRHLNDGQFEEAMIVIEEGIRDTQALLQQTMQSPEGDYTLHESMAPFHYLYGTTLLYSIEEQDQEVTTAGSTVSAAVVSGDAAVGPEVDVHAPAAAVAPPEDGMATAEEMADEMQIAWENFETARHIMESMMTDTNNNNHNNDRWPQLELDLAQICLREGDLQRMNGRNEAAIHDYEACLKLRKKSPFLGHYDRKIADVHYNLGLVYINVASKDDEEEETSEGGPAKTPSGDDDRVKEAKREMARNKSVYHFLECSKCFCGQIASICNADPATILRTDDTVVVGDQESGKPRANFKTTGEEDEEMEIPKVASAKLQTMRARVADLVSNTTTLTVDQREQVEDFCQLLGDIQETVDEAENSTRGVQEVANMKAQVAALAAADGDIGESTGTDGGVTTIGFGAASATAAAPAVASSVAASATAAPARPMMVVKKKKRAPVQVVQEPDAKKPKAAE